MKANVPQDLVDELNERYPHKCPTPKQSWEEAQRYAGKRELVDDLITFAKRQQKSILAKE